MDGAGLKFAATQKNAGNVAFKQKDYEAAVTAYTSAIKALEPLADGAGAPGGGSAEARDAKDSLVKTVSNRCQCYLFLGRPLEALRDAVLTYSLDPEFKKAKTRLEKARTEMLSLPGNTRGSTPCAVLEQDETPHEPPKPSVILASPKVAQQLLNTAPIRGV